MSQNPPIRLSLPNGRIELIHPPPPSDDPDTHIIYTHPHTLKHLPFWSPSQTLQQVSARRQLRSADPQHFRDFRIHHLPPYYSAESTGLPRLLGTVGFIFMEEENALSSETGIIITPEAHRGGYATEALLLLLDHGFSSAKEGGLGYNRLTFTTAEMNMAMRGWLENVTFSEQSKSPL